jgi:hypothetical protein
VHKTIKHKHKNKDFVMKEHTGIGRKMTVIDEVEKIT